MDVVHVAAFIFMFRVQGYEKAAERLYNAVMEKRFPAGFKKGLHEQSYPEYPLSTFKNLSTQPPKGFECLEPGDRQLFFMLWTVQMFDKRQKDEGEHTHRERLLRDSIGAARVLDDMKFSRPLLIKGLIWLPKELLADTDLYRLYDIQLMFISLTSDWYSELQKSERAQLCAFLEKYLKFYWAESNVQMEKLSPESQQFREVFDLEHYIRSEYFMPPDIAKYAWYIYGLVKLGCPVLFVEQKLNFCLKKIFDTDEGMLSPRHYLLMALIKARRMVGINADFGGRKYPGKELVWIQITHAITNCNGEISKFFEKNPGFRDRWEGKSSTSKVWATFKELSVEACAGLELYK